MTFPGGTIFEGYRILSLTKRIDSYSDDELREVPSFYSGRFFSSDLLSVKDIENELEKDFKDPFVPEAAPNADQ